MGANFSSNMNSPFIIKATAKHTASVSKYSVMDNILQKYYNLYLNISFFTNI